MDILYAPRPRSKQINRSRTPHLEIINLMSAIFQKHALCVAKDEDVGNFSDYKTAAKILSMLADAKAISNIYNIHNTFLLDFIEFATEHVLPVLEKKQDQTLKRAL